MARTKPNILVVEDNDSEREALARVLRLERCDVRMARNPAEAMAAVSLPTDLVISDLQMGAQTGIDLLRAWRVERPTTPFILLTAYGTVDTAVTAMKLGAADFLVKPVDPVGLVDLIHRLLGPDREDAEASDAVRRINATLGEEKIVGRSRTWVHVCEQALRADEAESTVLVLGESGTGKELIAESLHRGSARRKGPLVVVNMAAIPEALVESELFGHIKGAFTNAVANRIGRFQAASGGTLFIDEVGDFPLSMQAKLLRVLETRRVTPVGGDEEIPVDVRIVAATSRPVADMVQAREFREDLYYRLNVIAIHLPPLRGRRPDISLLVRHFLGEFSKASGREPPHIAPELMRILEGLDWPGNVRQLRNCLERMSVLVRHHVLTPADLPEEFRRTGEEGVLVTAGARLESLERSAILQALEQFDGSRKRAAGFLGISVRTLQRKLRDWGMAGMD